MYVVLVSMSRYIITKLFVPILRFATPSFMPLSKAMADP